MAGMEPGLLSSDKGSWISSTQRLLNAAHAAWPRLLLLQRLREAGDTLLCLAASGVGALSNHEPWLVFVPGFKVSQISQPGLLADKLQCRLAGSSAEQLQSVLRRWPLPVPGILMVSRCRRLAGSWCWQRGRRRRNNRLRLAWGCCLLWHHRFR